MRPPTDFVFATCRAGSEASLKREVAARYGDLLTPAFMRPQLITWKARQELPPHFNLNTVFASVSGYSAGMARSVDEVAERIQTPLAAIHVFPRLTDEDGVPETTWAQMDDLQKELNDRLGPQRANRLVLDVIVGEEGEPWFLGLHVPGPSAHPTPGGLPRIHLPQDAPSRAWLKMEQALAWLKLDSPGMLNGKVALELGSAPGGASWALLQRGMKVWGVDTGKMAPQVGSHPSYQHLSMPAGELNFRKLPDQVDLLASDMNLHPDLAIAYIEKLTRQLHPNWLILTLKMNDLKVEEAIPSFIQRIQRFAPGKVHARQLQANRREITVASA